MKKWIILPLCLLVAAVAAYIIMNSRTFQFFGGIVHQVDTAEKVVALTFDDGPTEKTEEVLALLDAAGIKATFFVNGNMIEENMDLARKIATAGHELGNHSYSHQRLIFKSFSTITFEVERTDDLIREAGYSGTIHFRPPNGKKLLFLPYYLWRTDRKTFMWTMEPESFPEIAASADEIAAYVAENVEPGSIILLHVMYDSRQPSVDAIPGIVAELKNQGYSFKTVSELLGNNGQ